MGYTWIFALLPLISAGMWLGGLLGMLLGWAINEHEAHLSSMDPGQYIPYISDIGTPPTGLQPLFIALGVVTTVFLDLAIIAERWLRHRGVLVRNSTRKEKILSIFAIIFAIAGAAGLILLTIFDTLQYPNLHDGFLLLFIGGYIISAAFTCAEYQQLGVHIRKYRILRLSFWIKLFFILVEIVLAICFIALDFTGYSNAAAVFEWVVSAIFTFWVLSYFIDLLPAIRSQRSDAYHSHGTHQRTKGPADTEMGSAASVSTAPGNGYDGYANDNADARPYRQTAANF